MGEEKGGNIFIHKGLILGKLNIGHGLGDGNALLKGRFREERHSGTRQGAVPYKLNLLLGNIR